MCCKCLQICWFNFSSIHYNVLYRWICYHMYMLPTFLCTTIKFIHTVVCSIYVFHLFSSLLMIWTSKNIFWPVQLASTYFRLAWKDAIFGNICNNFTDINRIILWFWTCLLYQVLTETSINTFQSEGNSYLYGPSILPLWPILPTFLALYFLTRFTRISLHVL